MSDLENTDGITEWDLIVHRIRGMEDPERDREQAMRDARQYDLGWTEACAWMQSDLRENKRQFGRRIEARIYREVRRARIAQRNDNVLFLAVLVTFVAACYLMTKVA